MQFAEKKAKCLRKGKAGKEMKVNIKGVDSLESATPLDQANVVDEVPQAHAVRGAEIV